MALLSFLLPTIVAEAVEIADRIALMNDGHVVKQGGVKQFLFDSEDAFVTSFFERVRFEAELKVMTVGDLLPALSLLNQREEKSEAIRLDHSLFTLFDQFSGDSNEYLEIVGQHDRVLGYTTLTALLRAFFNFKQSGA